MRHGNQKWYVINKHHIRHKSHISLQLQWIPWYSNIIKFEVVQNMSDCFPYHYYEITSKNGVSIFHIMNCDCRVINIVAA